MSIKTNVAGLQVRDARDTGAHTPIVVEKQNYFANNMYVHLLRDVILSRIINTLINVYNCFKILLIKTLVHRKYSCFSM